MFIDYNLYGMNMLNVAAVKFRRKAQDGESLLVCDCLRIQRTRQSQTKGMKLLFKFVNVLTAA